jgi:hypothetical protein
MQHIIAAYLVLFLRKLVVFIRAQMYNLFLKWKRIFLNTFVSPDNKDPNDY